MLFFLKKYVQKTANFFGLKISRIDNEKYFSFESLLYNYIEKYHIVKFIQIGGCDGVLFDPLYPAIKTKPSAFEGVILEPVEDYHKTLKSLYQNHDKIKTLRCAVHNTLTEAPLYKFDPDYLDRLPTFAKGVASFEKENLKKFNWPGTIVSEMVPCIKLERIMNTFKMNPPDLLLIDTEGYDAEILLNFDFQKHKPSIIRFEHGVPGGLMKQDQLEKILEILYDEGYEVVTEYFDATAYQRDLFLNWN